MRKARDFWFGFDPQSFEELTGGMFGPQGGYVRMVISYWDMAASFVENGAIDRKMYLATNGEFVSVFAKIEPYLPQLREMFGNPDFGANLEKLALSMPNGRQRIDGTLARMRSLLAGRAAAASNA